MQDVDFALAQLPVRPIQRQNPGRLRPDQSHHEFGDARRVQVEVAQKPLNAFVVRIGQRLAGKDTGDLGEANGLDGNQGHEEAGQERDPGLVPARAFERLFEGLFDTMQVGHRGAVSWRRGFGNFSLPRCCLVVPCAHPAQQALAMNPFFVLYLLIRLSVSKVTLVAAGNRPAL
jgi:hypothetical protein